jgi:glutathione peroxidase|tara:strand:- start:660 stop:1229 length:570 start_codon:yes stop_codon:yes gene_type:complete
MSGIYGISVVNLEGNRVELSKYKGKVLLIVNVASRCGFTSQYKELQRIHKKYRDKELFVLGFPCNDFADQEPGSADDIREFCDRKYGVTFDLFERVTIRGSRSHLLYEYLEGQRLPVVRGNGLKAKLFQGFASMMFWMKVGRFPQAGEVQWNFHKFVISREGGVKGHFASDCDPLDSEIITCIERELGE